MQPKHSCLPPRILPMCPSTHPSNRQAQDAHPLLGASTETFAAHNPYSPPSQRHHTCCSAGIPAPSLLRERNGPGICADFELHNRASYLVRESAKTSTKPLHCGRHNAGVCVCARVCVCVLLSGSSASLLCIPLIGLFSYFQIVHPSEGIGAQRSRMRGQTDDPYFCVTNP